MTIQRTGIQFEAALHDDAAAQGISPEVRRFLQYAIGLHFETRFTHEERWWPAPALDVGRGLTPYHPNLDRCLERMLEGEEFRSQLSVYRIARES